MQRNIKKTILVVDDESFILTILKRMLEKHGYNVKTAQNGYDALQHLNQSPIDLMLLDVMMPDFDGISLLKKAKSSEMKDIPTIMISGSNESSMISEIFSVGAEDFIQKPINESMLIRRVETVLTFHQSNSRRKELETQLAKEKDIENSYREKLAEIESMKNKVKETIETPMNIVVDTITEMMHSKRKENWRLSLITILKCLGSFDMYKPAFMQIKNLSELDDSMRAMLSLYVPIGTLTPVAPEKALDPETLLPYPKPKDFIVPEKSFGFDALEKTNFELKQMMMGAFTSLDYFKMYQIDETKMWNFLSKVETLYHDVNPYHNFYHASDVFQWVYTVCTDDKVATYLTKLDQFTLLLVALCHDLDHPGLNQSYLQNIRDEISMTYNDQAVLEMYHSQVAFNLFFEYGIVAHLPNYQTFRSNFIQLILATDMSQHFVLLSKFKTKMHEFSAENEQDRMDLMKIILKCADISNLTKPFPIAKKWACRCISEFHHQGDLEKEHNFPVGMLNDRVNFNFPKSQIGFVDYVAGGLFIELVRLLPHLRIILDNLDTNKKEWNALLDKGDISMPEMDKPKQSPKKQILKTEIKEPEVAKVETPKTEQKTSPPVKIDDGGDSIMIYILAGIILVVLAILVKLFK